MESDGQDGKVGKAGKATKVSASADASDGSSGSEGRGASRGEPPSKTFSDTETVRSESGPDASHAFGTVGGSCVSSAVRAVCRGPFRVARGLAREGALEQRAGDAAMMVTSLLALMSGLAEEFRDRRRARREGMKYTGYFPGCLQRDHGSEMGVEADTETGTGFGEGSRGRRLPFPRLIGRRAARHLVSLVAEGRERFRNRSFR